MTEERKTQDRCRCAACGGFMACEDEQCDKCKSFSKIPCDDCFEGLGQKSDAGALYEAQQLGTALQELADGVGDGAGLTVEYIFAATLDPFLTIGQLPLDNWGFDQPGTVGGLTWEDSAPNVDENRQYLWRSARIVPGIPAVGAAVLDSWNTPVVVGRWGPDGSAGDLYGMLANES